MEDNGRLIGVLEEHLLEKVEKDAQKQETGDGDADLRGEPEP